jgi:hypothetical protein
MNIIKSTIQQFPDRGPSTWAWSVTIDGGFCGIGYATTYADAAKLAARYVKRAEKYVSSLVNHVDK